MTGGDDFSRLHDEPSRHLRVFPAQDTSNATFALYEDDGISLRHRDGDYAEVVFDLETTAAEIVLAARVTGRYALPYRQITVEFPTDERRRVSLTGTTVDITLG